MAKIIDKLFKVPEDFQRAPAHPHDRKEFPYGRPIIGTAIRWMRFMQRLDVEVIGAEKIPESGGAMLAVNHTGYWDFVYGSIPAWVKAKRLVRFMAKKEIFDVKGVGALMTAMKHIPVDRAAGQASVDEAIKRLRAGQLVGIFPEATISRSFEIKEFRQGAAKIVHDADPNGSIPLIPLTIWGSQKIWTKGHKPIWRPKDAKLVIMVGDPVEVTEDAVATTERLHDAMVQQLERTRERYIQQFGPMPAGEYWVPASMGGSAPTLEEATAKDRQDQEARRRKREAEAQQRELKRDKN
ncbi:1-acyl-sn-glycerol-3-phosphate acyltransferase [Corynebacterium sp. 320]|uniref:lysophospholipid acyltransferase family protein n=1 Tax=Corynebacterium TaxID=1716 RepID=UPI00125CC1E0|nr:MULTISPECIES: lysophospholipid acyltransferase family protein [Corynebacterium]KAB1504344.1 1-acyl-sn-glycerol-3-phosphate acyltransferase [Corynebacterium sp. 320]KAB1552556.1 1-acyl-sn-glycerol-3-phosphate acyltransferase [Corynebacterium sp. 321]KAB3528480.1 1-acyl-sn-glycerol-3-phosphate acyltransferase [Corynebacterium sp. 250]QNP92020.1 1-acyl-sn-glycerol-3-phosphate acyltransferase [Corynebacterium zhongnanshanii]